MRKHPPDVNVSETCNDAYLKMVERRDQTKFPFSRCRNDARGQYPKLPLNEIDLMIYLPQKSDIHQGQKADVNITFKGR